MDNPPDNGPCEVTITAPDREWLRIFVRKLVEDRLIAAAHLDVMHTVYRWNGSVEEATEARVRIHTLSSRINEIAARVSAEHEFEVPCVTSIPITSGDASYLEWIREMSQP